MVCFTAQFDYLCLTTCNYEGFLCVCVLVWVCVCVMCVFVCVCESTGNTDNKEKRSLRIIFISCMWQWSRWYGILQCGLLQLTYSKILIMSLLCSRCWATGQCYGGEWCGLRAQGVTAPKGEVARVLTSNAPGDIMKWYVN